MKLFIYKLIGYKGNYSKDNRILRFTWGEINLFSKDFGATWRVRQHERSVLNLSFVLASVYVYTPSFGVKSAPFGESPAYGFYLYPSLFKWQDTVFEWNKKGFRWYMPWTYDWYSTELLDWNQNVIVKEIKDKRNWEEYYKASNDYAEKNGTRHPYTYILKNGKKQETTALIKGIERRTWRMRALPFIKHSQTTIGISFENEIGERAGSWKGGVIGTSEIMLPNETPEQTLRRMERDRKFN